MSWCLPWDANELLASAECQWSAACDCGDGRATHSLSMAEMTSGETRRATFVSSATRATLSISIHSVSLNPVVPPQQHTHRPITVQHSQSQPVQVSFIPTYSRTSMVRLLPSPPLATPSLTPPCCSGFEAHDSLSRGMAGPARRGQRVQRVSPFSRVLPPPSPPHPCPRDEM